MQCTVYSVQCTAYSTSVAQRHEELGWEIYSVQCTVYSEHVPSSAMLQPSLASCLTLLSLSNRDMRRGQNPLGTNGMM